MSGTNRCKVLNSAAPLAPLLSTVSSALATSRGPAKKTRLAVIGRGLVGAAAARHLSRMGYDVVLVGPSEPQDFSQHSGPFASHYDEGRIVRSFDIEPFWRQLNKESIARFGEIAAQSGIDFYREVGALHYGDPATTDVDSVAKVCTESAIPFETYRDAELAKRFPYLQVLAGMVGYFETRNAGYVSARRLVRAQTVAAQRAGAQVVEEVALGISESGSGISIRTASGRVEADRVLVAAGGHTEALLGRSLGFTVYARTTAKFRLDEAELRRLAGMPSIRCVGAKGNKPYILPPMQYPDGYSWLKLGNDPVNIVLETEADIKEWFRSGGSEKVADVLQERLLERLPGLKFTERRVAPCMTSFGKTGLPTIGPISDRISVAMCCYGKSAKCSDELGRLGALALLGDVKSELKP